MLQDIGLNPCPHAPCIFHGEIVPGKAKLYLGIYVDDFIYFSTDPGVEQAFQEKLLSKTETDVIGKVSYFLGIRFQWRQTQERLSVHLSQEAFADTLIETAGLALDSTTTKPSPFKSGLPVDSIPHIPLPPLEVQNIK